MRATLAFNGLIVEGFLPTIEVFTLISNLVPAYPFAISARQKKLLNMNLCSEDIDLSNFFGVNSLTEKIF